MIQFCTTADDFDQRFLFIYIIIEEEQTNTTAKW